MFMLILFQVKTIAPSFFYVRHRENKTAIEMNKCQLLKKMMKNKIYTPLRGSTQARKHMTTV